LISLKNENSNESFINRLSQEKLEGFQKYPDMFSAYGCLVNHLNIDGNMVMLGSGSGPILKDLFMVLDYDSIQIFNHGWELAPIYNKMFNKKVLANDFVFNGKFNLKYKPEYIGGDVLYITNPNCPTGLTFDVDTIFDLSLKFKYVIIDQAYENPLYFNDELLRAENVIVVKTFSKLGGVPGMRLGYCVANKNIIDKLDVIKDPYEISSAAVNYLKFITNNSHLIDEHLEELHNCFRILSKNNNGFSIHTANFGTFEDFGKLVGKSYTIDSKSFVRVTLTDMINHRWLLK
jgi:histidinol-phosphate aminotransferase